MVLEKNVHRTKHQNKSGFESSLLKVDILLLLMPVTKLHGICRDIIDIIKHNMPT